jgi:hypothetical protein
MTAADLGPLPAEKLVAALVMAEREGRAVFAVRWWKETTASLPPEQVKALERELKGRTDVEYVRSQLKL